MALPPSSASTDRRDDVIRLLADAPDGLSDADIADRLGGARAGVRSGTVNALCRRMVGEGLIERVGSRPIRNRMTNPASHEESRSESAPSGCLIDDPATPALDDAPSPEAAAPASRTAATTLDDAPSPEAAAPASRTAATTGARPTRRSNGGAPARDGATGRDDEAPTLIRDVAQAWSRTVNVQAALASWLTDRGATIRAATDDGRGPARDLVAWLDGDDVHVEITGWPPDGARTHPTTIAADWFAAAEDAARARRRTHPHARIVIALPDTRRYRALRRHRADALAGAGAEVWFVDPAGAVEAGAVEAGAG